MSSPESGAPQNKNIRPDHPEDAQYLGGSYNPSVQAYADVGGANFENIDLGNDGDQPPTPEQQEARDVLQEVQQLWNEADESVRQAVWFAMEQSAARKADIAEAATVNAPLDEQIAALKQQRADLHEAMEAEGAKNKIQGKDYFAGKYGKIADQEYKLRHPLDKLAEKRDLNQKSISNKTATEKGWVNDQDRNTPSFKQLMEELDKIEEEQNARALIRSQLAGMEADDPGRAALEQEVQSWGDMPDEAYRAERELAAGRQYEESLKEEKEKAKQKEWEAGFSDIQKELEQYIQDEAKLSDPNTPQDERTLLTAKRLEKGSKDEYRKTLIENVAPGESDAATDHYRQWLEQQTLKDRSKEEDAIEAKVLDRQHVIDKYVDISKKLASGQITEQKDIDAHQATLDGLAKGMQEWPEWRAFNGKQGIDKNNPDVMKAELVATFEASARRKMDRKFDAILASRGY